MPAWMLPVAKQKWRELVPHLIALGILAKIDRSMLAMWCQAWARHRLLEAYLDENGYSLELRSPAYTDKKGHRRKGAVIGSKARPETAELKSLREYLKSGAADFGFTPSSRTRLAVSSKPKRSKLQEFVANKAS